MTEKIKTSVMIKNKKAEFEYFLLETYLSGICLFGTEIKSIRLGKASLVDSFCSFKNDELFINNMHIAEYEFGNNFNHEPKRPRKLLLTKKELRKIKKKITEKGLTIIPVNMFINKDGLCKLTISIAKGKKLHEKANSIKEKDIKRDTNKELAKY
jgi:SsrA-binding protein